MKRKKVNLFIIGQSSSESIYKSRIITQMKNFLSYLFVFSNKASSISFVTLIVSSSYAAVFTKYN